MKALSREDLARIARVAPRFRVAADVAAGALFVLTLGVGFSWWQFYGVQAGRVWLAAMAMAALGRFAIMPYGCLLYLRGDGIVLTVAELDVLTVE